MNFVRINQPGIDSPNQSRKGHVTIKGENFSTKCRFVSQQAFRRNASLQNLNSVSFPDSDDK